MDSTAFQQFLRFNLLACGCLFALLRREAASFAQLGKKAFGPVANGDFVTAL
jgi:hypothetical protein